MYHARKGGCTTESNNDFSSPYPCKACETKERKTQVLLLCFFFLSFFYLYYIICYYNLAKFGWQERRSQCPLGQQCPQEDPLEQQCLQRFRRGVPFWKGNRSDEELYHLIAKEGYPTYFVVKCSPECTFLTHQLESNKVRCTNTQDLIDGYSKLLFCRQK